MGGSWEDYGRAAQFKIKGYATKREKICDLDKRICDLDKKIRDQTKTIKYKLKAN